MARRRVPKEIKEMVRRYRTRLVEKDRLPIDRVILFGSFARHRAHSSSDVDICVLSSRFNDPLQATRLLLHKRDDVEVRAGLEPIGFTPADFRAGGSLINEIKRTGVEVR